MERRDLLIKLGLSGLGLALGAGAIEGIARLGVKEALPVRLSQFDEIALAKRGIALEDIFQADPELFWRLAPSVLLPESSQPFPGRVSNSQGLREPKKVGAKRGSAARVLCVGDSCTFGYGVRQADALPAQIEAASDAGLECINAGVPGFSLFQGWRFLERYAAAFAPDLILLQFGWNESAAWDGLGDIEHYERTRSHWPPAALRWTHAGRLIWRASRQLETLPPRSVQRPRVLPYEFAALLEACARSCERLGARLALLVGGRRTNTGDPRFRDYRTPLQEAQYRWAERNPLSGLPASFDAVPSLIEFAAQHSAEELFLDNVHTTALAHRLLAPRIAAAAKRWLGGSS